MDLGLYPWAMTSLYLPLPLMITYDLWLWLHMVVAEVITQFNSWNCKRGNVLPQSPQSPSSSFLVAVSSAPDQLLAPQLKRGWTPCHQSHPARFRHLDNLAGHHHQNHSLAELSRLEPNSKDLWFEVQWAALKRTDHKQGCSSIQAVTLEKPVGGSPFRPWSRPCRGTVERNGQTSQLSRCPGWQQRGSIAAMLRCPTGWGTPQHHLWPVVWTLPWWKAMPSTRKLRLNVSLWQRTVGAWRCH